MAAIAPQNRWKPFGPPFDLFRHGFQTSEHVCYIQSLADVTYTAATTRPQGSTSITREQVQQRHTAALQIPSWGANESEPAS